MNQPDFDSIKQENVYGIEYWIARGLMPLLGYDYWQNFQRVIKKAMTSAKENGLEISDNFSDTTKVITVGKGARMSVKDYFLSKRACFLIAQNGDPEKPEIATVQNYFAFTAEFYDAQLKALKGVPEKEDYLDNITREELSAIDFKNVLTEGKLRQESVFGLDATADTHHFVGSEVRKAIEAVKRPMPEKLPSAPSIRRLVEERRRKQKRIKKNEPADDQKTLL